MFQTAFIKVVLKLSVTIALFFFFFKIFGKWRPWKSLMAILQKLPYKRTLFRIILQTPSEQLLLGRCCPVLLLTYFNSQEFFLTCK